MRHESSLSFVPGIVVFWIAGMALLVLGGSGAIAAPVSENPTFGNSDRFYTDTSQAELDRVMSLQPGGVQVSDNAVVWGDGEVVLVVPDPGERFAPVGLGSNLREDRLNTPALQALAVDSGPALSARGDGVTALATHGCPDGIFSKDYYCFYQYRNWGGRRVQFTGATSAADAADWGFNKGTTSWVSTDVDCTVKAYNAERPRDMSNYMWREPENSVSSYVGSTNDNRMSFWTCH